MGAAFHKASKEDRQKKKYRLNGLVSQNAFGLVNDRRQFFRCVYFMLCFHGSEWSPG